MHPETSALLLNAEADVNTQNRVGDTPLHDASKQGSIELIQLLIQAGAKTNVKNDEGESPKQVICKEAIAPCTKDMSKAIRRLLQ